MSFIRTDKREGETADALDRALEMAGESLRDLPPIARAGPASSLIRDVSEVKRAGASIDGAAAAAFVRSLRSRFSEDQLAEIRERVGARAAEIVSLTHDNRSDGPNPAARVKARLSRILRLDDDDARLLLESVALREAGMLVRSHEGLRTEDVEEMRAALRAVAASSAVSGEIRDALGERLVESGLDPRLIRPVQGRVERDPRLLHIGCCVWDQDRPYLSWHGGAASVAEALLSYPDELLGREPDRAREGLRSLADSWRGSEPELAVAAQAFGGLIPGFAWLGTFEDLLSGDSEFAGEVREWYWDLGGRDDPIPPRLVEDFAEAIEHYGEL